MHLDAQEHTRVALGGLKGTLEDKEELLGASEHTVGHWVAPWAPGEASQIPCQTLLVLSDT